MDHALAKRTVKPYENGCLGPKSKAGPEIRDVDCARFVALFYRTQPGPIVALEKLHWKILVSMSDLLFQDPSARAVGTCDATSLCTKTQADVWC